MRRRVMHPHAMLLHAMLRLVMHPHVMARHKKAYTFRPMRGVHDGAPLFFNL